MAHYYNADADITDLLPSLTSSQLASEAQRTTKLRIVAKNWVDSVYPGTSPFAPVSTAYSWVVNQADHASGDSTVVIGSGTNNPAVNDRFRVVGDYQWSDRDKNFTGLVDDSQEYRITAFDSGANTVTYEPAAQQMFLDQAPVNFGTPYIIRQASIYYCLHLAYIILRNNPEDLAAAAAMTQARTLLQMAQSSRTAIAKPESTWNFQVTSGAVVRV
jgi:hypothetical protein